GRLADSPDVPGNGRGAPVEEVLPQIFFSRRTPHDHLTCHARRPRGTASLPGRAARRRAPPPRHSGREQEAGLPRPGGPGTALVPRPTHAYAGAIWIMCRSHGDG